MQYWKPALLLSLGGAGLFAGLQWRAAAKLAEDQECRRKIFLVESSISNTRYWVYYGFEACRSANNEFDGRHDVPHSEHAQLNLFFNVYGDHYGKVLEYWRRLSRLRETIEGPNASLEARLQYLNDINEIKKEQIARSAEALRFRDLFLNKIRQHDQKIAGELENKLRDIDEKNPVNAEVAREARALLDNDAEARA